MLTSIQNLEKIQDLLLLRVVATAQYRTQKRYKVFCCSGQLLQLNTEPRKDTRFVVAQGSCYSSIQNLEKIQHFLLLRVVARAQYRTQKRYKVCCCSGQLLQLNTGHREDTRFVVAKGSCYTSIQDIEKIQDFLLPREAQYRTQTRYKIFCCSGQLLHINTGHREVLRYVVALGSCYSSIQYIEKIQGLLLLKVVATPQYRTKRRYKVCCCSGQLVKLNT